MKRTLILLAMALAVLPAGAADKLRVVATLEDLASIARCVGGDDVSVTGIANGGQDPHFLDAKPSYLVLLNRADVLIENGGELEVGWLPLLVNNARNRRILAGASGRVNAMNGIQMLEVPNVLSRAEGDVHPYGNPHFTIDPVNDKIIARNIAGAFAACAPEKAARFQANLDAFNKRIDESLARWQAQMAPLRGLKIVTFHKTFSYFAPRFGLDVAGTIEPKPGIAPSPGYLTELIVKMKTEGVKLVLTEPFRDLKVAQFAADKAGAKFLIAPSGIGGNAESKDLFSFFDWTIQQIVKAAGH